MKGSSLIQRIPLSPHPNFRYKAPVLQITWVRTINYHYLVPLELCVKVLNHHGIYTIYIYKIISTTTPLPSLPLSLSPFLPPSLPSLTLNKNNTSQRKMGPKTTPLHALTFSLLKFPTYEVVVGWITNPLQNFQVL